MPPSRAEALGALLTHHDCDGATWARSPSRRRGSRDAPRRSSPTTRRRRRGFGDPTNGAATSAMVSVRAGVGARQRALAAICKELFKNKEGAGGAALYDVAACTLNPRRDRLQHEFRARTRRARPLLRAFMQAMHARAGGAMAPSRGPSASTRAAALLGLCARRGRARPAPRPPRSIRGGPCLSKARLNPRGDAAVRHRGAPPRTPPPPSDALKRKRYDDEREQYANTRAIRRALVIRRRSAKISEYF